ncbi:CopG family ribbon-helix-helix protein [Xanthomonas campestris]|uniref:CopG family ribbon-helix-helix protein n=1 Tax=Xanthomonas campestris TaxID=339 RepID=UPI00279B19FA|nr:DNA-binding protein [Xanthomonas campestris]MEA9479283.1 DNA-binding protein [Xanthomonas campestris]WDK04419.1 DNA-binding protein [Xanthomonas campestris]
MGRLPGSLLAAMLSSESHKERVMQSVSQVCYCEPVIRSSEVAMSTTTIRLPDELKARVARAAKDAGTTAHGFIVDAIAEKIEAHERRTAFHAEAQQRWAAIEGGDNTLSWADVRQYMQQLADGGNPAPPVASAVER